jgi:hypothetical protein
MEDHGVTMPYIKYSMVPFLCYSVWSMDIINMLNTIYISSVFVPLLISQSTYQRVIIFMYLIFYSFINFSFFM